jgi:hypothetical protein
MIGSELVVWLPKEITIKEDNMTTFSADQTNSRQHEYLSYQLTYLEVMGFFYPSTQRHYRGLILLRLLLILLHVSVVRPS